MLRKRVVQMTADAGPISCSSELVSLALSLLPAQLLCLTEMLTCGETVLCGLNVPGKPEWPAQTPENPVPAYVLPAYLTYGKCTWVSGGGSCRMVGLLTPLTSSESVWRRALPMESKQGLRGTLGSTYSYCKPFGCFFFVNICNYSTNCECPFVLLSKEKWYTVDCEMSPAL